jgi:hypothetical protein
MAKSSVLIYHETGLKAEVLLNFYLNQGSIGLSALQIFIWAV